MGVTYTVDGVPMKRAGWHLQTKGTSWRPLPGVRHTALAVPGRPGHIPVLDEDEDVTTMAWRLSIDDRGPDGRPGGLMAFNANLDALVALCSVRHRLLDVRQTITDGATTLVRQADAQVIGESTPDVNPGALRATWSLVLSIPSVYWRDPDPVVWVAPQPLTAGQVLEVTTLAGATAPLEDGVFRLSGPITNPKITDPATGAWTSWAGTVAAGRQLRIHCGRMDAHEATSISWTGTTAGATSGLDASSSSRLLRLTPAIVGGDPLVRRTQLVLDGTGMAATTKLELQARRAYR